MMFSYFPYAAAFSGDTVDGGLVAISLALAPLVLVAVAFLSRHPRAATMVLRGMGLFLAVGLTFGLLAPVLGAAAGYAVGGALALRPPEVANVFKWRIAAVTVTVVYMFILLLAVPPAGVFAGGILPLMMIGFADEYAAFVARRDTA
jgi:hypothetical protein